jgi:hypothetical protein
MTDKQWAIAWLTALTLVILFILAWIFMYFYFRNLLITELGPSDYMRVKACINDTYACLIPAGAR